MCATANTNKELYVGFFWRKQNNMLYNFRQPQILKMTKAFSQEKTLFLDFLILEKMGTTSLIKTRTFLLLLFEAYIEKWFCVD